MIYAILAYHPETKIAGMTAEDDDALMDKLLATHARLDEMGSLGPAARLDFTQEAKTVRGLEPGQVLDGPFAETKEQLLGFYLYECKSMDEAVEAARELRKVNMTAVYEIRPVKLLVPGRELGLTEDHPTTNVSLDLPAWMVRDLDKEAQRLGVTRQALIKMWIAEKLG